MCPAADIQIRYYDNFAGNAGNGTEFEFAHHLGRTAYIGNQGIVDNFQYPGGRIDIFTDSVKPVQSKFVIFLHKILEFGFDLFTVGSQQTFRLDRIDIVQRPVQTAAIHGLESLVVVSTDYIGERSGGGIYFKKQFFAGLGGNAFKLPTFGGFAQLYGAFFVGRRQNGFRTGGYAEFFEALYFCISKFAGGTLIHMQTVKVGYAFIFVEAFEGYGNDFGGSFDHAFQRVHVNTPTVFQHTAHVTGIMQNTFAVAVLDAVTQCGTGLTVGCGKTPDGNGVKVFGYFYGGRGSQYHFGIFGGKIAFGKFCTQYIIAPERFFLTAGDNRFDRSNRVAHLPVGKIVKGHQRLYIFDFAFKMAAAGVTNFVDIAVVEFDCYCFADIGGKNIVFLYGDFADNTFQTAADSHINFSSHGSCRNDFAGCLFIYVECSLCTVHGKSYCAVGIDTKSFFRFELFTAEVGDHRTVRCGADLELAPSDEITGSQFFRFEHYTYKRIGGNIFDDCFFSGRKFIEIPRDPAVFIYNN